MKYLIFASLQEAVQRTQSAYLSLKPDVDPACLETTSIWSIVSYPTQSVGAAVAIPDAPIDAGLDIPQETYDSLLEPAERLLLVDTVPLEWLPTDPMQLRRSSVQE